MTWRIRVYENSHYQDEEEAYDLTEEFPSWDAALRRAQGIVERSLATCSRDTEDPSETLSCYQQWGDDPVIIGAGPFLFSAWDYAAERLGFAVAH